MYFLITQADINSVAILTLLALILYFVSGFNKIVKERIWGDNADLYLNTRAKIKAIDYALAAIITIDVDGRVLAWNQGAQDIFGWKESEMLGKPLIRIIPARYRESHLKGLEKARSGKGSMTGRTLVIHGVGKDGKEFPARITIWKWEERNTIFYTGIVQNITEEQVKDDQIDKVLNMYQRSEEIDHRGCWSWDVLNDIVTVSKGFEKIFDIERGEMNSSYLLKRIYHEDLKQTEDIIQKAFENKKGYTVSYRVVTRDGNLIRVIVNAATYLNEKGELINITGTIHKT